MDLFSQGFVEILAAEQTPDNSNWFQGTADAVRQAARHITRHEADYYVILAGDHLYRMDYSEIVEAHIDRQADITIAAQPVAPDEASAMGILRFDREGQIVERMQVAHILCVTHNVLCGRSIEHTWR
jgi:glucose-1-phosphate adenylyltransferase